MKTFNVLYTTKVPEHGGILLKYIGLFTFNCIFVKCCIRRFIEFNCKLKIAHNGKMYSPYISTTDLITDIQQRWQVRLEYCNGTFCTWLKNWSSTGK
jgi:hypothetical protein